MEQTDLYYNGITRTPSDHACKLGDLAECVNLISQNNEIEPISTPPILLQCDGELLFIHKSSTYHNFIVNQNGVLKAFSQTTSGIEYYPFTMNISKLGTIYNTSCLGNTLILLCAKGIYYLLFKDNNYKLLGQKPPFIPLSFGLKGSLVQSEEFTIDIDNQPSSQSDFTENNITIVTNEVIHRANKLIAENSTTAGKFIYPFFVRYAFRLYDDSLIMHSAPVLMIPSTVMAPLATTEITYTGPTQSASIDKLKTRLQAHACTLDYLYTGDNTSYQELQKWNDIIKSIDIFLSEPIYTYDQNGKCSGIDYSGYQYWGLLNLDNETSNSKAIYKKHYISKDRENAWTITMPSIAENVIKEQIENCALFYKIASIKIEDITTRRTDITIKNGLLSSLSLQERMTDDYASHNLLQARYSYVYNARLNITNISQQLFEGFPAECVSCYANENPSTTSDEEKEYSIDIYTFVQDNNKEIIMKTTSNIPLAQFPLFLYYPNVNAHKVVIVKRKNGSPTRYAELQLSQHKALNGAYFFNLFKTITWTDNYDESLLIATPASAIPILNKIYTSEINNPFSFPVSGINTIGTGEILGIAAATKALSQGQFGQFPLYAFTSDGIWALEISNTGTYSSKQVVSRDVCNNPASITQIDGAIIFTSDRGIMILQGSDTQCISDIMLGKHFRPDTLDTITAYNPEIANMIADISDDLSFLDYIRTCSIAYDYPNARLVFNNPSTRYHYIYSLRSGTFTKLHHGKRFPRVVNNYPDCFLQDSNGYIYNYSAIKDENATQRIKGILVTRPLSFGTTSLKTITRILHRGTYKHPSYIKIALYGSRNGTTFYKLHSLRGMGWKFFRLVLYTNLLPSERLSYTSFIIEEKFTNKLR